MLESAGVMVLANILRFARSGIGRGGGVPSLYIMSFTSNVSVSYHISCIFSSYRELGVRMRCRGVEG